MGGGGGDTSVPFRAGHSSLSFLVPLASCDCVNHSTAKRCFCDEGIEMGRMLSSQDLVKYYVYISQGSLKEQN